MKPTVLVVEDEDALATLLRYNLEKEGYEVRRASDGEEGLLLVAEETPDLVVLDWMLPKISGVEVCRQLRARPATRSVPILMLTARSQEADKVRGLEIGADDYVVKPFARAELLARIKALLRRAAPAAVGERLEYAGIVLDRGTHRVTRAGRSIHLGPTEFRLLDFMMQRPGRVFSRERLLDAVWGMNAEVDLRTVDVHIGRLRKALNEGASQDAIRTVRSAGYALDVEA